MYTIGGENRKHLVIFMPLQNKTKKMIQTILKKSYKLLSEFQPIPPPAIGNSFDN